jgi:hypothetical protein
MAFGPKATTRPRTDVCLTCRFRLEDTDIDELIAPFLMAMDRHDIGPHPQRPGGLGQNPNTQVIDQVTPAGVGQDAIEIDLGIIVAPYLQL